MSDYPEYHKFAELIGQTFIKVTKSDKDVTLITLDSLYMLAHQQDCCEHVYIESVAGDIEDLVGSPILYAEEYFSTGDIPGVENPSIGTPYQSDESHTWTFYKIGTIKGSVTIRFYGSSSGYYSESARLLRLA